MTDSLIYNMEEGTLKRRNRDGSKVDGHVHSSYSGREPNRYVGTPLTKLMGVRESYASPKKIHQTAKKRGLRFCTISDHDSILGALEMRRKYPEDSFISCEYTVRVGPEQEGQAIHAGVWGLDYPGDTSNTLSEIAVKELHNELLGHAQKGYEKFVEFCLASGVGFCLNHPAWQGNPKKPLSGHQIHEITDAFPVLEINGDCQLENLVALEIARDKNKVLCAGTDAHSPLRIGKQYTASLHPVDSIREFLQAFRLGRIGIGSTHELPDFSESYSLCSLVRYKFNGTVHNLRKEAYKGVLDYVFNARDWSLRKTASLVLLFGAPSALSSPTGLEITLPALFAIEGFILASLPYIMPRIERMNAAKRTRKLYSEYQRYLASLQTEKIRKEISRMQGELDRVNQEYDENLPELISKAGWWDRILLKLLGRLKSLHCDYDMGEADIFCS